MSNFVSNVEWLQWPQSIKLAAAFSAHPQSLRFVGGAVRDALLSRTVQDVDAATTLLPEATLALLEKSGIRAIPTGIRHGTVTAVIDGRHFEITTLRKDVSCDGRHAEVAFTDDWKADALRRDFTMNALYLSPEGELFDEVGGQSDAKAGRVRFIGDANQRIREDYLRILRFFRFYAHYGHGAADAEALAACAAQATHLDSLSGERIWHELSRLLMAPDASTTLALMHEQGILSSMLGFAVRDGRMWARFEAIERTCAIALVPVVKLAGFIMQASTGEEAALSHLADRLKLSRAQVHTLEVVAHKSKAFSAAMNEAQQKHYLRKLGPEDFRHVAATAWAYGREPVTADHPYANMLALPKRWQAPLFPVSGDDLIKAGCTPGKAMGQVLQKLEEAWEASDYMLTKEALLAKM